MSVAVTYTSMLKVVETLTDTGIDSADNTVTFNNGASSGINKTAALTGATTPPVTQHASGRKTMSAGAGTLDLRAIPGVNGATLDFNGLKVQCVKFRNLPANANAITITEGASNGYELLGNAFTMILQPGQEIMIYGNDATPDVGATTKTIDIAGTASQILEYEIVAG